MHEPFLNLYKESETTSERHSLTNNKAAPEPRRAFQTAAAFLLVVTIVFLVYQVYLAQNSFSALNIIAQSSTAQWQRTGSIWPLVWLTAESFGEVGLWLRLVGACFFVTAAVLLLWKKRVSFRFIRNAVFLESAYFLFYIPFEAYLITRPGNSAVGVESGISYALQTLLVSPALFMLYRKMKRFEAGNDAKQIVKWFGIAFVCYVFAMWVKSFLFAFYAVGIDFSEPVLIVGSVNSMVTLLLAAVGSVIVLLPVIRGTRASFSVRGLGAVLSCVSVYFVIFLLISQVNAAFLTWLPLTEWWAASLLLLGIAFIVRGKPRD
jgi:hypothetical protein